MMKGVGVDDGANCCISACGVISEPPKELFSNTNLVGFPVRSRSHSIARSNGKRCGV
ncbi:hypothetical protein SERLA73DRAFT_137679, partial [Serpula lacrymans var. lacrymans S7.3]